MNEVIPLSSNQYAWGFVCGRISFLEGKLLTRDFFLSILSREREEDIFQQLRETRLREVLVPGSPWADWIGIVDNYFHDEASQLRKDFPDPAPANLFLLAGDYLNLKRAILQQESYPFRAALLSEAQLHAVAGGSLRGLSEFLGDPVPSLLAELTQAGTNRHLTDVVLDAAYLRHLLAIGADLNIPLIQAYLDDLVEARVLVVLWRAARAGLSLKAYQRYFLPVLSGRKPVADFLASDSPPNWIANLKDPLDKFLEEALQLPENEQIPQFELRVANHLTKLVRICRGQVFGPERAFGYIHGLTVEAFNLKLAVSGRMNRIDPNLIRRRLRECYV